MDINKEPQAKFTITSYDAEGITIHTQKYTSSTIVSKNHIEANWGVLKISELDENNLQTILNLNPEIIIIGHDATDEQIPMNIRVLLANKRIGIESMSVGSACRTFNILLNDNRNVVYAYIKN